MVRFAHPAGEETPRELSKTAPVGIAGSQGSSERLQGTSERSRGTIERSQRNSPAKAAASPAPSSPSSSPQSFHTMVQDSPSREYTSPLRAKRADVMMESPERNLSPVSRSYPSPNRSVSSPNRSLSPDNNAIRGNDSSDLTIAETIEPMMQELRTYIHRELSDLKGDMVRQFCEQERIIQEQQEEIERLLKRLNQGGYACLLPFIRFRGNNRIETQLRKCFLLLLLFLRKELPKTQFVPFPPILRLMVRSACPRSLLGVVDPEWVQKRMGHLRILDATLILDPKRDAAKEFTQVNHLVRHYLSRSTSLERSSLI